MEDCCKGCTFEDIEDDEYCPCEKCWYGDKFVPTEQGNFMENINSIIERKICIYCKYNVASNSCKCDQYKRCTEYGKEFFDGDYFKEKYLKQTR